MTSILEHWQSHLKPLGNRKNVSDKQAAERLGVAVSTYRRWKISGIPAGAEKMARLAMAAELNGLPAYRDYAAE
jgi:transcriptional regulator with XRE-family HTH domain